MSSRERWTVYPLIFLTLGIALKDKITRHVDSNSVQCKTLVVTDNQGKPRVIVAPTSEGGIVQTVAAQRSVNVVLGQVNSLAGLMLTNADGKLLPLNAVPIQPKQKREPNSDEAEKPPDSR